MEGSRPRYPHVRIFRSRLEYPDTDGACEKVTGIEVEGELWPVQSAGVKWELGRAGGLTTVELAVKCSLELVDGDPYADPEVRALDGSLEEAAA